MAEGQHIQLRLALLTKITLSLGSASACVAFRISVVSSLQSTVLEASIHHLLPYPAGSYYEGHPGRNRARDSAAAGFRSAISSP